VSELAFRRVLVKLSGEALAGERGFGLDFSVINRLADEIHNVQKLGVDLGLVLGGGNIVRGTVASQQGMDRVSADYMGMLATVINALAVQDILERKDVNTRVQTAIRMEELAEPYIRRRALRHLEKDRVVLFAGGTGNPYFSTDTAAVLRALEIEADVIIKATNVDGVYTDDPNRNADAEFLPELTFDEALIRGLKIMDANAFALCRENGLPIVVMNVNQQGAIARVIRGERVGTIIRPENVSDEYATGSQ
jgi:uridylate kinase